MKITRRRYSGNGILRVFSFLGGYLFLAGLFILGTYLKLSAEENIPGLRADGPKKGVPNLTSSLQIVNKGAKLLADGKSLEAEVVLGDAVVANPESPEAMYNFGLALSFNGKWSDAVYAFLKAIELRKSFPEAHHAIGSVYFTTGDYDQALKAFDNAISLASEPTAKLASLHNRGLALMKLNRMVEAKSCFMQILKDNPDDSAAAFQLGKSLLRERKAAEALIPLETAVRDFPLEANFFMTKAFLLLGKKTEAAEALKKAEKSIDSEIPEDIRTALKGEMNKVRKANGL